MKKGYEVQERSERRITSPKGPWDDGRNLIVRIRRTDCAQRRPGRNDRPEPLHRHWNNELSGSKRNILHGGPDGLSTSSTSLVPGEWSIVSSRNMDFSFALRQSHNRPANDSSDSMSTACGWVIHSSSAYGASARSMWPGSPMIVHVIAWEARSTCTKMLPQLSTPYSEHSVMDESQEKSTSIMGNNLSLKRSKRKLKNTVLNWSSAGQTTHVAAVRSNGITRRFTRNWSVSRNSVRSVISGENSGTSTSNITTGASRRSWTGWLQPQSTTTKSISTKTENI